MDLAWNSKLTGTMPVMIRHLNLRRKVIPGLTNTDFLPDELFIQTL